MLAGLVSGMQHATYQPRKVCTKPILPLMVCSVQMSGLPAVAVTVNNPPATVELQIDRLRQYPW